MKYPFFCVNAFCLDAFSGNPAGVCILRDWLSTDDLQRMASQMNFSETAFLFPAKKGFWSLRWFSPKTEIFLCGHATLAAAHILFERGIFSGDQGIIFSTAAGDLKAEKKGVESVAISLPNQTYKRAGVTPLLIEALGAYPDEVYLGMDYLCVFSDESIVREINPDFALLRRIDLCRGVVVTSESSRNGYDFISRFFAPRIGIDEDCVTGSTHCMLAPYWGKKLGKMQMTGWQASPRGGEIRCEMQGNEVILCGRSETFFSGEVIF